ncbi:MAG: hypothetical protein NC412_09845 [Roseburia sp.]|nr:hypothetical protein [Roseburia sp.]
MLYYYNKNGRVQKESSKEYKTEKGAVEKLRKEGQGAVFDETGKMVLSLVDEKDVPEGALDTNEDGSVPAYNEDNEQVGIVDAETVAKATGKFEAELEGEPGEPEQPEGEPGEMEQPEGEPGEPEQPEGEPGEPEQSEGEPGEPEQSEGEPGEPEQPEGEPREPEQTGGVLFDVQTSCDSLRIRSGAGKDYRIVGYIREKAGNKKNHTIMDEENGWGKLASGEGWIELAFTKKVS